MQMVAVKLVSWRTPLFVILISCFVNNDHALALQGREGARQSLGHYHTIEFSSLLPSSVCNPSKTKGPKQKQPSTLEVVHRHGPCSGQEDAKTTPSLLEVLSHDQSRVDYIQSQLVRTSNRNKPEDKEVDVPAQSGIPLGSNYYIVSLSLGTPKQPLSLALDTVSELTWTRCKPCIVSCNGQQDPIFNPSESRSFSNVSCSSTQCSQLSSVHVGRIISGCGPSDQCVYGILYGSNKTVAAGFLGKETLTLTPGDVIQNFIFGCGRYNEGNLGKTGGVLGLGQSPVSIVTQTSQKYGKYFSYCLPSSPSSTGHLTFGKNLVSRSVEFIPLVKSQHDTPFYFINVTSINLGGRILPIKQETFKSPGTIIDSGTVITRLDPVTYSALRATFTKLMGRRVPRAPSLGIFDTCYDLREVIPASIPAVAFTFDGNVTIDSPNGAYVYDDDTSRLCLAFAANKDARDVSIFGSTQQQSLEVAFDVAGGKIGFGINGCD
ncbi:protein ASPARTIC PROTEASE IN GUARD cell 2-like [Dorcoceras hygrometricum]|uniref:Protein ASPARTIC PROTEASE IN GUARD cell 2-like n=1 Tax=Dorcoceras hygrometricum TaxID=472368 RepID=A0A2Z7C6N7_9LAMI|nr:protein ASPARTIC PROTEASE IN GUARD cell 2-like [Dorcoceras hygrometricum]